MGLTIYSLFAFLAAPLMGQWSDRIGRKISLTWCIVWTSLSYFLLLIQPWYRIFLLARAVNGITGGNLSIIQAILTDISPDQASKNKNFGLMWALFWLWFIIWPVLGSIMLGVGGVELIFWFGGILAILQVWLLVWLFENTNTHDLEQDKPFQYNPFRTISKFITRPELKVRLRSFILVGIGGFVIHSGQSLYMNNYFGTPWVRYGYYLAGLWIISAINMAVFVPRFRTKHFSNTTLFIFNFLVYIVGLFLVSSMVTEMTYMLLFYVMSLLWGVYSVLYNVEVMSHAKTGEIGELSGMFGSLQSMTMVLGPLIAGILLESTINMHWWAAGFYILAACILFPYLLQEEKKIH